MIDLPATPPAGTRCIHLCGKSMMVHGEGFAEDPDFQAGLSQFWCVMTSRALGPDQQDVGLESCSNPLRDCYRDY